MLFGAVDGTAPPFRSFLDQAGHPRTALTQDAVQNLIAGLVDASMVAPRTRAFVQQAAANLNHDWAGVLFGSVAAFAAVMGPNCVAMGPNGIKVSA